MAGRSADRAAVAPKDCRNAWASLFGAVCPARGISAGLVLPAATAAMMNFHLDEISRQVAPDAHRVVVMDGTDWHQTGDTLRVPDNITPLHLPPYAPELGPVKNVWAFLRSKKLANRI